MFRQTMGVRREFQLQGKQRGDFVAKCRGLGVIAPKRSERVSAEEGERGNTPTSQPLRATLQRAAAGEAHS